MYNQGHIDVESGEKRKSEVITFCNFIIGEVGVLDKLKTEYSVTRISYK